MPIYTNKAVENNPINVINNARTSATDLSNNITFPQDVVKTNKTIISFWKYNRYNPVQPIINSTPGPKITLPIPMTGLQDNTSLNYSEVALGSFIGGLSTELLGDKGATFAQKSQAALVEVGSAAAKTLAGGLGDLVGQGDQAAAVTQNFLGVASNPNLALTFNGVKLRNHKFSWRFIAKNSADSNTIQNIIYTLKIAALPELIYGANFSLAYPYTCTIDFTPSNIVPIGAQGCFLTDIEVKYDGQGYPIFFKDTNQPVVVDLALSFTERSILTATDYNTALASTDSELATVGAATAGAVVGFAAGGLPGAVAGAGTGAAAATAYTSPNSLAAINTEGPNYFGAP